MLKTLSSHQNEESLDFSREIEKREKAASCLETNPGHLACAFSALLLSYDNQTTMNAPATIIYIYCSGGTKMLQSHTQQLLSMCFQNSIGIDRKIFSIRRKPMLSGTFVITWCPFPVNETPVQQAWGSGAKWKKSRQFLCLFSMFFRYLAKYIGSK